MKKTEAMSVGQIISQAIASTGNRADYDRQRACYLWEEVVGPYINRNTTRRWVEGDVLHVIIASAALKSELKFHTQRIAQLLNDALGQPIISDISIH